jgi:hypothetical protein
LSFLEGHQPIEIREFSPKVDPWLSNTHTKNRYSLMTKIQRKFQIAFFTENELKTAQNMIVSLEKNEVSEFLGNNTQKKEFGLAERPADWDLIAPSHSQWNYTPNEAAEGSTTTCGSPNPFRLQEYHWKAGMNTMVRVDSTVLQTFFRELPIIHIFDEDALLDLPDTSSASIHEVLTILLDEFRE